MNRWERYLIFLSLALLLMSAGGVKFRTNAVFEVMGWVCFATSLIIIFTVAREKP